MPRPPRIQNAKVVFTTADLAELDAGLILDEWKTEKLIWRESFQNISRSTPVDEKFVFLIYVFRAIFRQYGAVHVWQKRRKRYKIRSRNLMENIACQKNDFFSRYVRDGYEVALKLKFFLIFLATAQAGARNRFHKSIR